MQDDPYAFTKNWLECIAFDDTLSHAACRVAIMIAMHRNRETRDARVGLDMIAAEAGMTKKGARGILQALAKRGLLRVSLGGGAKKTNVYLPILPNGYVPLLKRPRDARLKLGTSGDCLNGEAVTGEFRERSPAGDCFNGETVTGGFQKRSPAGDPNPLLEPLNPQSPQKSNGEDASSSWEAFTAVWPIGLNERWRSAKRAFSKLSAEERRLAIDNVGSYLKRCADQGKAPLSRRQWIREKGWGYNFPEAKAAAPQSKAPAAPGVWVAADSPEWRAWLNAKGVKSHPQDARGGWRFPSRRPPGHGGDGGTLAETGESLPLDARAIGAPHALASTDAGPPLA